MNQNEKKVNHELIGRHTNLYKINILYLIIIIFTIVTLGTYALISWMSDENTEISFRIGKIAGISCSGESEVTLSNLGPVLNYEQDGDITEFVVQNESGNSVGINAVLYIESISDSLKKNDFKYAVQYSTDNSNFQTVSTGNFSVASANTKINILSGQPTGATGYFRIIFYIDGNMQNPISMQNSTLKGRVKLCTTAALASDTSNLAVSYPGTNTFNYTYDGDGIIICSSENTSVATCSINNSTKVVTVTSVAIGSTTITLSETESSNLIQDRTEVAVNVSYQAYTVSYNANGGSSPPAAQTKQYGDAVEISDTIPRRGGYAFLGWNTSSTATSASYSPGSSYTDNANVTLYAVWKSIPVGAYISYTANGYSSWRVMYNNSGQLDIVSTGSAKDVTLSGNGGYVNAVQTLNNTASSYVTGNATSARSIGCTSSSRASFTVGDNSVDFSGFPYEDSYYTTDVNQLKNNGLVQTDKEVWLASRYVRTDYQSIFGVSVPIKTWGEVRSLMTNGTVDDWTLQGYTAAGWMDDSSVTLGFRPVVSLSSGLTAISGDGTSQATAYVLIK